MNKEESKKQFGKNLKRLRMEKGLSQEELARALGFKNRSSINKIEIGRSNIPTDKIQKTAEVLGVSPLVLFQIDGEEIKGMIDELSLVDKEDMEAIKAASEAHGSMPDLTEEYFSTRTRSVIRNDQPEYIFPNSIIDTYKKLSLSSKRELEKYAEYLLAKEQNK